MYRRNTGARDCRERYIRESDVGTSVRPGFRQRVDQPSRRSRPIHYDAPAPHLIMVGTSCGAAAAAFESRYIHIVLASYSSSIPGHCAPRRRGQHTTAMRVLMCAAVTRNKGKPKRSGENIYLSICRTRIGVSRRISVPSVSHETVGMLLFSPDGANIRKIGTRSCVHPVCPIVH